MLTRLHATVLTLVISTTAIHPGLCLNQNVSAVELQPVSELVWSDISRFQNLFRINGVAMVRNFTAPQVAEEIQAHFAALYHRQRANTKFVYDKRQQNREKFVLFGTTGTKRVGIPEGLELSKKILSTYNKALWACLCILFENALAYDSKKSYWQDKRVSVKILGNFVRGPSPNQAVHPDLKYSGRPRIWQGPIPHVPTRSFSSFVFPINQSFKFEEF